ncbi:MAG: hypothetical protein KDK64_06830, partial [Chlamydiia bacterium]|nr:hypothetical protein [Chlamydiia bacterium]
MTKEENFIIFSDIKRLFFKTKWVILTGACFFGGIGFFIRSQVPVRHEVTAIFKEVGQTQTSLGNSRFDTLLHSIGIGGDKQEGHVLLLSSIILEPVVEKLGMQAEVSLETTLQRKRRFLKESLNAERGRSIQEPPHFIFSHVRYKGEEPRRYQIFFTSRESFEVRKGNNQVAATGLLGEPVVLNDVIFTLNAPPKDLRLRHNYSLTISPLAQKVLQLRKLFEVTPLYGDASLLSLEMIHSDRSFAICVLNEVMESYKNYLTRENARVTEGQLAYLEKRRDDYMDKMDEHLEAHMQYLKESLATKGALNLGQHLPLFQSRKQELMSDLMSIDLKISELLDTDPHFIMDIGHEVASLQKELHQIAKERDALTLAFVGKQDKDNTLEKHLRRLDVIEQEELRVKTGVDTFFSSLVGTLRQRDQTLIAVGDFGKVLSPDANQLKKVQQEKKRLIQWAQENAGVRLSGDYLKHQLRLLSLQEGALKQRLFHGTKRGEEYQGIDLDTARRLLLSYVQERDQAASKIAEMIFAKQQIDQDHAEWVSLAAIFPDAISQEMVKEMGEMKKQLRKERMLTEKERERLEKKFSRMKEDLFLHIAQTLELSQLEKERNEDRITSVRMAILDLLGQEVSLIEKQIEDRIEEKLAHLEKEKELVSGQLSAIKAEMKEVPDAWLREHRLKFAADMNKGMLEALVQLV